MSTSVQFTVDPTINLYQDRASWLQAVREKYGRNGDVVATRCAFANICTGTSWECFLSPVEFLSQTRYTTNYMETKDNTLNQYRSRIVFPFAGAMRRGAVKCVRRIEDYILPTKNRKKERVSERVKDILYK